MRARRLHGLGNDLLGPCPLPMPSDTRRCRRGARLRNRNDHRSRRITTSRHHHPARPRAAQLAAQEPASITSGTQSTRTAGADQPTERGTRTVIVVTPAEPADAEDLAALAEEMDHFYGATQIAPLAVRLRQISDALFNAQPTAFALLARDNGQLVGFAAYSFLWPAV